MITTPFDRRAAQQFDDLLEGRIAEASQELTKLLAFAEQVWAVPAPEPRPDFTASLRARLMEAAPSALAAGAATPIADPARTDDLAAARRRRQIAAAVAAFSVAGAATGTAFAAENSLPGETLYPVKRIVEDVRSRISLSDGSKGAVEVERAHTRLTEATELAKEGKSKEAEEALTDFVTQAKSGASLLTDAGKGGEIHDFTDTSLQQITGLAALLPVDLLTPILTLVIAIDKAATSAFPGAGDGLSELPNTLTQILAAAETAKKPVTGAAPAAKPTSQPTAKPSTPAPSAPAQGTKPSTGSKPSSKPSSLGGVVGGLGDAVGGGVVGGVGGAVDDLGKGVGGPVGGVVSGLGQTVEGLGKAVDDLLNGVGGALDGKPAE